MPTTPPTFVAGTELAAADLNLLRDGISELQVRADGTDYLAVQVQRAATQTIPDSTDTEISFDTQIFDIGAWWSSGTDIIVPSLAIPSGSTKIGGRMFGNANFATGGGVGARRMDFLRNGSVFATTGEVRANSSGAIRLVLIDIDPNTEAADVFTVVVWQNSGGALSVAATITLERAGVTG